MFFLVFFLCFSGAFPVVCGGLWWFVVVVVVVLDTH